MTAETLYDQVHDEIASWHLDQLRDTSRLEIAKDRGFDPADDGGSR